MVDRRHARMYRDEKNRWIIANARSRNGLWARIQEVSLGRGVLSVRRTAVFLQGALTGSADPRVNEAGAADFTTADCPLPGTFQRLHPRPFLSSCRRTGCSSSRQPDHVGSLQLLSISGDEVFVVLIELIQPTYLLPVAVVGFGGLRSVRAHEQHFVVDVGLTGTISGLQLGREFLKDLAADDSAFPGPVNPERENRDPALPSSRQWLVELLPAWARIPFPSIPMKPLERLFGPCSLSVHLVTVYFLGPP